MNPRFAALVLFVALVSPAFAQSAFEPLAAKIRAQRPAFPTETAVVSLTPADAANPRQEYVVRRTEGAGGYTTEWKSTAGQSLQSFRADGTLLSSRQTDLGRDTTIEIRTNAARTSVQTVVTEKGRVKSDKKADLKPGIVLRDELPHLNEAAWAAGVRDGLKFQSLSPDGGMAGDFQIVYRTVADPTSLSDKYAYPAEFRSALAAVKSYVVADMMLQGVGAFFFPHHFYVLYEDTPAGLEWRGYFGEDPKKPVFQYLKK